MKTFKQIVEEKRLHPDYHNERTMTICVEEWLTQKRQAHGNKCEGTEMLDELLEDLKQ
jgi:hypothetical protein